MRSLSSAGSGRRSTAFSTLKMATVEPMPSAIVSDEHGREDRAHRQLTEREPKIVPPVGPPLRSAHGMLPLFCKCSADSLDVLDVSEAAQRFITRRRGRQALGPELLDAHLEMERELVVHVGGRVGTPEAQISAPERECLP